MPMARKNEAPHALEDLFKHEGVPPEMIMDGSNE